MVEISKSGSGEGPGRGNPRAYSTELRADQHAALRSRIAGELRTSRDAARAGRVPVRHRGGDYVALRVGRLRSDYVAPDRWARAIAGVPREGMVSGRVRI